MPRTMLNDQHWSKLETILRNFDIYLKRNLRNFIEAILYRIRTGCPWRIYHQILVIKFDIQKI
jgi:transposase